MAFTTGLIRPREMGTAGQLLQVTVDQDGISQLGYTDRQTYDIATADKATTGGSGASIATSIVFAYTSTGIYLVDGMFLVQSGVAATGLQFALDTSTAVSIVTVAGVTQLANSGTFNMCYGYGDGAYVGSFSALPDKDTSYPVMVKGLLVADGTHAGTATLRLKCEDTTTDKVTLKEHSSIVIHKIK